MGRYVEASCRLCRRENEKLFLKGEKCSTEKCPFGRRSYAPGQHGKRPVRASEYRIRLREKQKARQIYGVTEKQFRRYYREASRKPGATGEMLLQSLERRLDNVVYRLGFATSRSAARQLLTHNHILLNDKSVDIPSFQVKSGDIIKATPSAFAKVKETLEKYPDRIVPAWLTMVGEVQGKIVSVPKRSDIETTVQEHLIVEYYSR